MAAAYLWAVLFYLFRYFVDQITDSKIRNIICAVLSVVAVLLLIVTRIQNRKRPDTSFSWGFGFPPMAITYIAMFEYYSSELF